jgi:hypothetical protein
MVYKLIIAAALCGYCWTAFAGWPSSGIYQGVFPPATGTVNSQPLGMP